MDQSHKYLPIGNGFYKNRSLPDDPNGPVRPHMALSEKKIRRASRRELFWVCKMEFACRY
jgi:hypothetical protein